MAGALWSLPVLLALLLGAPGVCASSCRAALSAEAPVYPGNGHLQPLSESVRKYVMSHFRWNKFGRGGSNSSGGSGRKRHEAPAGGAAAPVGAEGAGPEREAAKRSYSMEHFRWGKPVGRKRRPVKVYPNGVDEEAAGEGFPLEVRRELPARGDEDDDEGAGGARHLGWRAPLKDKRYGGFMGAERGRAALLTLFKNAIARSAYKKGH
ncbi:pro-opiomelanocortin [Nothoprocta perdicaria]|uniref:pro-opiomelanocortin n=1 Tax=Nothoprocta perdicaria TaxID=30464 RepID=UPI000E1B782C|nr:pro-opiomelanocortin [Nothoprocta perdicaria]